MTSQTLSHLSALVALLLRRSPRTSALLLVPSLLLPVGLAPHGLPTLLTSLLTAHRLTTLLTSLLTSLLTTLLTSLLTTHGLTTLLTSH